MVLYNVSVCALVLQIKAFIQVTLEVFSRFEIFQCLAVQHLAVPVNKKPNLVGKPSDHGEEDADTK